MMAQTPKMHFLDYEGGVQSYFLENVDRISFLDESGDTYLLVLRKDGAVDTIDTRSMKQWTFTPYGAVHHPMKIEFSDGHQEEIMIDNIKSIYIDQNSSAINNIVSDLDDVSIYPNPSGGNFSISIRNPSQRRVDLSLIDNLGEKLCRIYSGEISGEKVFSFNGDKAGLQLTPGVYYIRLQSPGDAIIKKVVIIR
jgi:hypothetical protein